MGLFQMPGEQDKIIRQIVFQILAKLDIVLVLVKCLLYRRVPAILFDSKSIICALLL